MRKRNKRVHLRFDEKEYNHLEKLAKKDGSNMSVVLRKRINSIELVPKPSEFYGELYERIHAIGIEINNIAHEANSRQHITPGEFNHIIELEEKIGKIVNEAEKQFAK